MVTTQRMCVCEGVGWAWRAVEVSQGRQHKLATALSLVQKGSCWCWEPWISAPGAVQRGGNLWEPDASCGVGSGLGFPVAFSGTLWNEVWDATDKSEFRHLKTGGGGKRMVGGVWETIPGYPSREPPNFCKSTQESHYQGWPGPENSKTACGSSCSRKTFLSYFLPHLLGTTDTRSKSWLLPLPSNHGCFWRLLVDLELVILISELKFCLQSKETGEVIII